MFWEDSFWKDDSYLAAERCEKVAIELEQSAIKEDEKRVIDNFLMLMVEAKALKIHIAKITNKAPDVRDFERYGKNWDFDRGGFLWWEKDKLDFFFSVRKMLMNFE